MRQRLATAAPVVSRSRSSATVVWWALRQEPPELPRTQNDVVALLGALGFYTLATLAPRRALAPDRPPRRDPREPRATRTR